MAPIKCSSLICCLLVATVAAADIKFLAKEAVPNGAQPFSIGVSVNPLSQVISMIQTITDDVRKEATDEFKIFDNFACFCKDKTKRLSKMVKHHAKEIDVSSANIAMWTTETGNYQNDHKQRSTNHEKYSAEFDNYKQYLKEENANWNSMEATFRNNMQLIKQALSALKSSKTTANAFLQVPRVKEITNLLEIADAMGLVMSPKHKAVAASLLQGKGGAHANPLETYGYHEGSDDVIDLVESIQGQLRDTHRSHGEEHEKSSKTYQSTVQALRIKIRVNKRAIAQIERSVTTNKKETAEARTTLIENNEDLKDTQDVLHQITTACENRATEYDMRFAARQKELEALNTAMACLTNAHGHAVRVAGGGALLQGKPLPKVTSQPKPSHVDIAKASASQMPEPRGPTDLAGIVSEVKAAATATADADTGVKAATKALSFLQTQRANLMMTSEERKMKALDVIRSEGQKTQSLMLMSLALNSDKDPFEKVKQLITDLRFRLEAEAQGEVNKQVWCNQNLEIARHERDAHFEHATEIGVAIERIDAHMEVLKQSIKYHTDKAIEIGRSLVLIYTDISQLSEMQMRAMNIQTEARDEIQNAIHILRSYYSGAAKAASNPYTLAQVDGPGDKKLENFRKERMNIHDENERRSDEDGVRNEDRAKRQKQRIGDLEGGDPSAVRSGSLGDAIALMETIVSDFNREIGNLKGDLDAEHKELVRTNAVLEGQKKSAETMADRDTMELKSAKVDKSVKIDDMKTQTNLMDLALKELANLSPTCIDTGMTYSQRVKKREQEMAALKTALCILDEHNVEVECK